MICRDSELYDYSKGLQRACGFHLDMLTNCLQTEQRVLADQDM